MTVGQVLRINTGTQQQYRVPSGYEAPSIAVLNPNNGTIYIARNRSATVGNAAGWDFKVPSQSYALLPGPYIEAGIFYQDQSGSGAAGEVTLYDLPQKVQIPLFQAIGIAALSVTTSMDVTQGVQPSNPPLSTSRLWADTNNHLHILNNAGVDYDILDENNAASFITPIVNAAALGGDLAGTISNANVLLRQYGTIRAIDTGGIARTMFTANQASYTDFWNVNGNLWRVLNQAGSTQLFSVDNTGNVAVTGSIIGQNVIRGTGQVGAGANVIGTAGDLFASRGAGGTGAVYLGDANHYLFWNGGNYIVPAGTFVVGAGNLGLGDGYALYWGDPNSRVFSQTRTTYFDEYGGSWNWRNSSNGYPIVFSIGAAGRVSTGDWYKPGAGLGLLSSGEQNHLRLFNPVNMNATVGSIYGITTGVAKFHGIVMIIVDSAQMIMAALQGGANTTTIIWSNCGATAGFGVGSTYNVGFSVSDYYIENRTGAAHGFIVTAFGYS